MRKELARNSISGVLQVTLTALLAFVSVPIFIAKLGMEQYGVFSVISVIGNLSTFTNLGLNGALLVFLGKQGKCRQSDHDIVVTQIIMGAMVFSMTILLFLFSNWILSDILEVPSEYKEARPLLIYLLIANSVLLMGQSYTAILDSMFCIHISNMMQFIYSLIYWGGQILVVSLDGGLEGVGLVAMLAAIFWFTGVSLFARKRWGKLDLSGMRINIKSTAKKQFSYGARLYSTGLISFLFVPLSKILVSRYAGLDIVAIYEIGLKIKDNVNMIIAKALFPLQPYINREPIGKPLHNRIFTITSLVHIFVVVVSCVVIFTFPGLLKIWLQKEYTDTIALFTITITIGYLISSPTILMPYMYLSAKGHPEKNALLSVSAIIVNFIVFFSCMPLLAEHTILLSYSLGMIASYIAGMALGKHYIETLRSINIQFYLKLIALALIILLPCSLLYYFIQHSLWDILIYSILVAVSAVIGIWGLQLVRIKNIKSAITLFKK